MSALLFCLLAEGCGGGRSAPYLRLTTGSTDHVIVADQDVRLPIGNIPDGSVLTLNVTDPAGRPVPSAPAQARVTGNAVSLPLSPGWYHLSAAWQPQNLTDSIDFAVARPRSQTGFRDSSPFGITCPPSTSREWDICRDMGAAWVGWAMPWADLEISPGLLWYEKGAPPTTDFDGFVRDSASRGIRNIIQFRLTPLWANAGPIGCYQGTEPRGEYYPPDDEHWGQFEQFISLVVDRYRPYGVNHFAIWNEPDASLFKGWATDHYPKVEAYQRMLAHARPAILGRNPAARIAAPGADTPHILDCVENGYAAGPTYNGQPSAYAGRSIGGAGASADIVSVHLYPTDWQSVPKRLWPPEVPNPGRMHLTLTQRIADSRAVAGNRELWNTEFGYSSAQSRDSPEQMFVTEDEQASLLVRHYVVSLAAGMKRLLWYTWKDTPTTGYGILRGDGVVKPAYTAYRTMADKLEGLSSIATLEAGPEQWIVRFTGAREVLVVWKITPEDVESDVGVPWSSVKLTRRDGAATTVTAAAGKVRVLLRRGEPLYLEAATP